MVSIITPSYNQAPYLEHTMRSVLTQDYPAVEYIVIDGGSTDGSPDIIRRKESRLAYWVSEADAGQASAIQKGMARARGEIVAWLNSDDVYLPGAVARAVAALREHPQVGMVYANGLKIDGAGRVTAWPRYGQFDLIDLLCFHMIHQPTVFLRRSVFEAAGGLSTDLNLLMDHELWIRMAAQAPTLYVDDYWAAARDHAAAKNTAHALNFGAEARLILDRFWQEAATAPALVTYRRRSYASTLCLDAQYLLADGRPLRSLQRFVQALALSPGVVRRHWLQVGLGLLSVLGLGVLESPFRALRRRLQPFPPGLPRQL